MTTTDPTATPVPEPAVSADLTGETPPSTVELGATHAEAAPLPPAAPIGRQGNYAGGATRMVAFALDVAASWGIFTLGLAGTNFALQLLTGHQLDLSTRQIATLVGLLIWEFAYFSYQWSLGGKTIGMALLGIRVVCTDGEPIGPRQAMIRTVTLPLSFLLFGLGFIGILLNRDRHALHDRFAHTVVVYSWDARASRLRWLAKREPGSPR